MEFCSLEEDLDKRFVSVHFLFCAQSLLKKQNLPLCPDFDFELSLFSIISIVKLAFLFDNN
jgi:hypothetical protein